MKDDRAFKSVRASEPEGTVWCQTSIAIEGATAFARSNGEKSRRCALYRFLMKQS